MTSAKSLHLFHFCLRIAKSTRRLTCPALVRAIETAGIGETEQVSDFAKRVAGIAHIRQREVTACVAEQTGVTRSFLGKLALEISRAHVQGHGDFFLR